MSSSATTDEPVRIAIAVVEHEGQYLVGQRPGDVVLAGKWEFPGGKIQPGESAPDAAIRECLEETGLAVRLVKLLGEVSHTYDHGRVLLSFFHCEPTGEAQAQPLAPFCWRPAAELASLDFPAANAEIIARLVAHI